MSSGGAVAMALLVVLLAGIAAAWRAARFRRLGRERLARPEEAVAGDGFDSGPPEPFVRPNRWLPILAGLAVGAVLYSPLVGWGPTFSATFGVVAMLLAFQADGARVERAGVKVEEQLANAIDLMVAALHAGGGATQALENAASESRRPLRPQLENLLGRVRLGDDPQDALLDLQASVPLEPFRLFSSALSIHWETGGSLAPTLATVGRAIRDRIEVGRRVRALSTQARASSAAVLLVTYFIAAVIWRNDPERMRQFLGTSVGGGLAAGAVVMQAVGLFWTARLSRVQY